MNDTKETITATGSVKMELFDENGKLKHSQEDHNLVVTVGKTYLATWIAAASQSGYFMQYIGLGTGGGGPSSSDTDLTTPLATRVAGTLSSSSNVWQNQATFGPGVDTGAITEAGLFSASSSGTMFARKVFSVFNKEAGDTLIVTWSVTIS